MARKNRTNTVSGHDGYYQKVDRAQAGLESDPRQDGNLFCRADARVTQPDVKGKITGPAALDIHSTGVMLLNRWQPDSPAAAQNQSALFPPKMEFTQNWGLTRQI